MNSLLIFGSKLTWFEDFSFLFLVSVPFPALRKLDMLFGRWKSGLLPSFCFGGPKFPRMLSPLETELENEEFILEELFLAPFTWDSLLLTASLFAPLDFVSFVGLKACLMLPTRFILTLFCTAELDKPGNKIIRLDVLKQH